MAFEKIFAVTPNPVLDLMGNAHDIIPNEKNYVENEQRTPGGNAVNAARVLHRLEAKVVTSGFLGGGVGKQIEALLKKEGLSCAFVAIGDESRVNVTVKNESNGMQTRFSFAGPKISAGERLRLFSSIKKLSRNSLVLLGGSFPPGFRNEDARKIIELGHSRRIPVIVDVPVKSLEALIKARPMLIKPNLHEFQELTGKKFKDRASIIQEGKKLLKHCPLVVISSVEKGVLLLSKDTVLFAKGPRIEAKSGVGAGDSMVGAIAGEMLAQKLGYDDFFGGSDGLDAKILSAVLRSGLGASLATVSSFPGRLGSKSAMKKHRKVIEVELLESF